MDEETLPAFDEAFRETADAVAELWEAIEETHRVISASLGQEQALGSSGAAMTGE